jgi:hypothetical protein
MQIVTIPRTTPLGMRPLSSPKRPQADQPAPSPSMSVATETAATKSTEGWNQTGLQAASQVAETLLATKPEPGSQLQTTSLLAFNRRVDPRWASKLTDIMQHEAPDDNNPYPDLITKGHETTHGINNWLMNNAQPPDGGDGRWHLQIGLYLLDNKSVVIWEPNMKKDKVAAHVPQSLRGSRFDHYVAGTPSWNDHPLYLWDEWVAYTNGTEVGLNQLEEGKWTQGNRIASVGPMEFTVYALATGKAIAQHDPKRWKEDSQLRELLAYNSKRAMAAAEAAQATPELKHPRFEEYLTSFRTSPDAAGLRAFCQEEFGTDFCKKVYGFE